MLKEIHQEMGRPRELVSEGWSLLSACEIIHVKQVGLVAL